MRGWISVYAVAGRGGVGVSAKVEKDKCEGRATHLFLSKETFNFRSRGDGLREMAQLAIK